MIRANTGTSLLLAASFVVYGAGILVLGGCKDGHDHAGHTPAAPAQTPAPASGKPYPLKTCVVSGEELGKMGEVKRIVFEGQEVKFCCPDCEKDFRKDPKKYMKMIEDARK